MGSSTEPSKQILGKLFAVLVGFYALYFSLSALMAVLFEVESVAKMPFDFNNFDPADSSMIAGWLACVGTYLLSTFLLFFVVRSSARTWDYACSVTFLHLCASMIIMGEFATNWIWWVTVIVSTMVYWGLGWFGNVWRENRTPSPINPMGKA